MSTENYNLPLIADNMTNDVVRDMNALAAATDEALKSMGDSKANGTDLTTLNNKVNQHLSDFTQYKALVTNTYAKKQQEHWTTVTLQNGWTHFGGNGNFDGAFMKDEFGFIHLRGLIKNGVTTIGTTLFILPAGYRPSQIYRYTVIYFNGTTVKNSAISVRPDGVVAVEAPLDANNWLSIDNGIFQAEL